MTPSASQVFQSLSEFRAFLATGELPRYSLFNAPAGASASIKIAKALAAEGNPFLWIVPHALKAHTVQSILRASDESPSFRSSLDWIYSYPEVRALVRHGVIRVAPTMLIYLDQAWNSGGQFDGLREAFPLNPVLELKAVF